MIPLWIKFNNILKLCRFKKNLNLSICHVCIKKEIHFFENVDQIHVVKKVCKSQTLNNFKVININ